MKMQREQSIRLPQAKLHADQLTTKVGSLGEISLGSFSLAPGGAGTAPRNKGSLVARIQVSRRFFMASSVAA